MTHSAGHGAAHWRRVCRNALRIARAMPGTDAGVAFLFGLFHDCARTGEDDEAGHGARGAAMLEWMRGDSGFPADYFSGRQCDDAVFACRTHTEAPPTERAVIGACYDGDRLDLWHFGIEPDPAYLSTRAGRMRAPHDDTDGAHDSLTWADLAEEFCQRH